MNKKVEKILNILAIVMVLISIATNVLAVTPAELTPSENVDTGAVTDISRQIIGVLQTIGIIVSVLVLMVLGIRYMMGSASEKSEYKKTFIPYIVGAACIFAASVFAQAIFDFFSHMSATQNT